MVLVLVRVLLFGGGGDDLEGKGHLGRRAVDRASFSGLSVPRPACLPVCLVS